MEAISNALLTTIQSYEHKMIFISHISNMIPHIQTLLTCQGNLQKNVLYSDGLITIEEILVLRCLPVLFIYSKSLEDIMKCISETLISCSTLIYIDNEIITNGTMNKSSVFKKEYIFKSFTDFEVSFPTLLPGDYLGAESKEIIPIKKCPQKIKRFIKIKNNNIASICKKIMLCIREHKSISLTELTDIIFKQSSNISCNFDLYKNIQRRVHNTIKILHSLKVIKKHKNIIIIDDGLYPHESLKTDNKVKTSQIEIKSQKDIIIQSAQKLYAFKNIINNNKKNYRQLVLQPKHYGEFFICYHNTIKDTLSIKTTEDQKRVILLSNSPINIITYDQIIKEISPIKEKNLSILQNSLSNECYEYITTSLLKNEENKSNMLLKQKRTPVKTLQSIYDYDNNYNSHLMKSDQSCSSDIISNLNTKD